MSSRIFKNNFYTILRHGLPKLIHKILQYHARMSLMRHKELWNELSVYIQKSNSTGCAYSDYLTLYRYIRGKKFGEILECGTGVSTIVIAQALKENEQESGIRGRVTSMEEEPHWYEHARVLLPSSLEQYVDLRLSGVVEDGFGFIRGVCYKDVPDIPYGFVFVDGPRFIQPDGTVGCDFDFVRVVQRSDQPVYAMIDRRITTCFAMQVIFGIDKVRFDYIRELGFIGPCSRKDLEEPKKIGYRLALWRPLRRIWFFQRIFRS